jgi:hypothetical protein
MQNKKWLPVFFAAAACSWMPHWACHYYRLETQSSFVLGSWEFSRMDSYMSMVVYSGLILLNLISVVNLRTRFYAALLTGLLHSAIGVLHVVRMVHPFRFEVFGYAWPLSSSLREVLMVFSFGIICLAVALRLRKAY